MARKTKGLILFFFLAGRKHVFRPVTRSKKTRFLPTEKEKLRFIHGSKKRMAQIARKLPSEAKPRTVNCDLGLPWLKMYYFSVSGKKHAFAGRAALGRYALSRR